MKLHPVYYIDYAYILCTLNGCIYVITSAEIHSNNLIYVTDAGLIGIGEPYSCPGICEVTLRDIVISIGQQTSV